MQASAENLPFPSDSFEAALAVSTVHHWGDLARGLREMRRVADKRIVYFSEPARYGEHWIVDDYFPEIVTMATNLSAPRGDQVAELLGGDVTVEVFETPTISPMVPERIGLGRNSIATRRCRTLCRCSPFSTTKLSAAELLGCATISNPDGGMNDISTYDHERPWTLATE